MKCKSDYTIEQLANSVIVCSHNSVINTTRYRTKLKVNNDQNVELHDKYNEKMVNRLISF